MNTESQTIITPFEDPFFRPDWRHQLAAQLATDPKLKHAAMEALRDEWVRAGARYLRKQQQQPAVPAPSRVHFDLVYRWGLEGDNRQVGRLAEALLLTEAPLRAIAEDLGCGAEDIHAYERMFFNVRDADGAMVLSPAQRTYFAGEGSFMPTTTRPEHLMWRRMAVSAGYKALVRMLELGQGAWTDAPSVDLVEVTVEMSKAETLAKLASGSMSTADLLKMEANRIKDRLVRHTTGELRHRDEGMELALQLLQMMAPKMVDHQRVMEAMANRVSEPGHPAQDAIDQTEVADRGPISANDAINRELEKKKQEFRRIHERQKGIMQTVVPAEVWSGEMPAGNEAPPAG